MNALTVTGVAIRQDDQGRYCLNDLHKSAGGAKRHAPNEWMRNKQTKALIEAIDGETRAGIPASPKPGIPGLGIAAIESIHGGEWNGTYVVKELVYAYAMWISPVFNLTVIRTFDAVVNGEIAQHENYWFSRRPLWSPIRVRVLAGEAYRNIAAALEISRGRVARAVKSMIRVGLLDPRKVAEAQIGPAKKAAIRYGAGWGQTPASWKQLDLLTP